MAKRESWDEFRKCGMLWFVNRILHIFGWVIVLEINDKNKVQCCYPAKIKYRGFTEDAEDCGFLAVTKYMKDNAEKLLCDIESGGI